MNHRCALLFLFLLLGCSSSPRSGDGPADASPTSQPAASQPVAQGTTVVLLRHAEKAPDPGDGDPELSERGAARAQALVDVLSDGAVDAIYATQYKRTQQTVEPLATARGLRVRVLPAGDVRGLVEAIHAEHAGRTVVVCGHSNTVPKLVEALGGEPFPKADYGKLYVLEGTEEVRLQVRSFGD